MGICTNCPCGYCVIPLGEECPIKGYAINNEVSFEAIKKEIANE